MKIAQKSLVKLKQRYSQHSCNSKVSKALTLCASVCNPACVPTPHGKHASRCIRCEQSTNNILVTGSSQSWKFQTKHTPDKSVTPFHLTRHLLELLSIRLPTRTVSCGEPGPVPGSRCQDKMLKKTKSWGVERMRNCLKQVLKKNQLKHTLAR